MPGPLPKPTVLRLVESGGRMRTRFKERAKQEPRPRGQVGAPPVDFTLGQLEVWFRLVEACPDGLLTAADREIFEGFVVLAAAREKLRKIFNEEKDEILVKSLDDDSRYILQGSLREYRRLTEDLRILGRELGFSPAARTRVQVAPSEGPADPLAEFMGAARS